MQEWLTETSDNTNFQDQEQQPAVQFFAISKLNE